MLSQHHLEKYDNRIIVAGTRGYNDYDFFVSTMKSYIQKLNNASYIFITGKAGSGADEMIIRFCKQFGKTWIAYPAKWNDIGVPGAVVKTNSKGKQYNAVAGHIRNEEMAKVATHLITYFDGKSPGTKHMLSVGKKYNLKITTFLVDVVK